MGESDASVVARARGGDHEAFQALVERHSRRLFRLAHRMTGNPHDAEDVVQETFIRAFRELGRFESRANVGTWLYRIAANCSIDMMRSRAGRQARQTLSVDGTAAAGFMADQSPAADRLVIGGEIQDRVAAVLDGLTHLERSTFVLRHLEGMSIAEIRATLGFGENAIKQGIFRAMRKMRVALHPFVENAQTAEKARSCI